MASSSYPCCSVTQVHLQIKQKLRLLTTGLLVQSESDSSTKSSKKLNNYVKPSRCILSFTRYTKGNTLTDWPNSGPPTLFACTRKPSSTAFLLNMKSTVCLFVHTVVPHTLKDRLGKAFQYWNCAVKTVWMWKSFSLTHKRVTYMQYSNHILHSHIVFVRHIYVYMKCLTNPFCIYLC